MNEKAVLLAAESKKAWDANDFKRASRLLHEARVEAPEEVLVQLGDGRVGSKTGVNAKGEAEFEAVA